METTSRRRITQSTGYSVFQFIVVAMIMTVCFLACFCVASGDVRSGGKARLPPWPTIGHDPQHTGKNSQAFIVPGTLPYSNNNNPASYVQQQRQYNFVPSNDDDDDCDPNPSSCGFKLQSQFTLSERQSLRGVGVVGAGPVLYLPVATLDANNRTSQIELLAIALQVRC